MSIRALVSCAVKQFAIFFTLAGSAYPLQRDNSGKCRGFLEKRASHTSARGFS